MMDMLPAAPATLDITFLLWFGSSFIIKYKKILNVYLTLSFNDS